MSNEVLAAAAVAVNSKTGVPTVSGPAQMDWGSALAQFLRNEAPILEALAAGGVDLALHEVPFGQIALMFVGPKMVKQYVDQGITLLAGVLDKQPDLVASNAVEDYVFQAMNTYEPQLAKLLGDHLNPLIKSLAGKAGVQI